MDKKVSIYDLDQDSLRQIMLEHNQPLYRAGQIWQWLYMQHVSDFDSMTNLPRDLRESLKESYSLSPFKIVAEQHSTDKQTKKVLLQVKGDNLIETVLMRYEKRRTLCISTQAGCAMGCIFCATGQMGFQRQLTTGEIVSQVIHFARDLKAEGDRVTNIVLMGMGEPLHNYENTMRALNTLTDGAGFNLGARKITLSTVGMVPAMRRFADEARQFRLAVSLHAATDEERNALIPVNRRWPIVEIMDACRYYIAKTGRRITFEWALIHGINDTNEQARLLGNLIEGMLCHVNLIPLNPTAAYGGRPSSREGVAAFQSELAQFGVSSSVRVRRGIDIQAGCGQLRDRIVD